LADGTHYFASQTIAGCESANRLDVICSILSPFAPTGNATQEFCISATVADLSATGTGVQWYASSIGGTALSASVALVNGSHYYASQTISGCESAARFDVTATISMVNIATTVNQATITANATGAVYQWLNCNTGFSAISGATSQSFTASVSGNYAVMVTQGSCSDTSVCVQITVVGIEESGFANELVLYPNPTNGIFSITSEIALSNASIRIFDLNGKLMSEKTNLNGNNFDFNLQEVSNGIYFAEIITGEKSRRIKLLKE